MKQIQRAKRHRGSAAGRQGPLAIDPRDPDIVHAHWTYEFALGAIESRVPTVVTAHDAPLSILRLNPTPYRLARTVMAWQVADAPLPLSRDGDSIPDAK